MNDKELADKVIGLGIGERSKSSDLADFVYFKGMEREDHFVRDWRVAGVIMKRVADEGFHISMGVALAGEYDCHIDHLENDMRKYSAYNKSLPRAIVEAGVEALKS